jgi:hypothetical protein
MRAEPQIFSFYITESRIPPIQKPDAVLLIPLSAKQRFRVIFSTCEADDTGKAPITQCMDIADLRLVISSFVERQQVLTCCTRLLEQRSSSVVYSYLKPELTKSIPRMHGLSKKVYTMNLRVATGTGTDRE